MKHQSTKYQAKSGFTIIEVMIFVAISGMLLVGVLIGISSAIARQRYNDATESFAEFLRQQYAFVINPQIQLHEHAADCTGSIMGGDSVFDLRHSSQQYINGQWILDNYFDSAGNFVRDPFTSNRELTRGRSSCALYGVMLTFSEGGAVAHRTPLIGADFAVIRDEYETRTGKPISTLASATELPDGTRIPEGLPLVLRLLSLAYINYGKIQLGLDVKGTLSKTEIEGILNSNNDQRTNYLNSTKCSLTMTGPPESEEFRFRYESSGHFWGANGDIEGTIFILRSPMDGTVQTYYTADEFDLSFKLGGTTYSSIDDFNTKTINLNNSGDGVCAGNLTGVSRGFLQDINNFQGFNLSARFLEGGEFETRAINICVTSEDTYAYAGQRRMIKIGEDGRNPTAVSVIDRESEGNICDVGP